MTNLAQSIPGSSLGDINAIFEALGIGVDNRDIASMKFSDVEWGNNKKVRKAVTFDAKKIIEQFFKKADENPRGPTDPMITVGDIRLYEKNDAKTDLMFFLNVFLERGNNLQKILLTCDNTIASILKRKASAYGIALQKGQNKTILRTTHLTLAGLAKAFAHCTATIILKDGIASKLKSRLFPKLPILMGHTIFPALIPQAIVGISEELRDIAQFVNIEMSQMLADPIKKRKMAFRSLEDLSEQSQMYVDAAMNGSVLSNSDRLTIMYKAKILVINADKRITFTDDMQLVLTRMQAIKGLQMHPLSSCLTQLENQ